MCYENTFLRSFLPWVFSNVLPHCKQHCGRDEAVFDDEWVEIGRGVADDVAHDGSPAAGEVVLQVDHAVAIQAVVCNSERTKTNRIICRECIKKR